MPPSPRLLVTDLDGTLLTSRQTVTPASASTLRAVRAAGIRLAVASARPYRLVEAVLPPEVRNLFSVVIVSNGAAIVDPTTQQTLHQDTLSDTAADEAIEALRHRWPTAGFGWESGPAFSSDLRFLTLTAQEPIRRDPHPDRVAPRPVTPVLQLVMAVPGEQPGHLISEAAALLGSGYSVTDSRGGVLEISRSRVTKASAAQWWARSLALELDTVLAFGDEHNDLPLLTTAGTGVAMGNADPDVRQASLFTTTSNDEDGVAAFLAHHVLPALGTAR